MAEQDDTKKRRAPEGNDNDSNKRSKTKKQWKGNGRNNAEAAKNRTINPGDSGIWATCDKGREGKCIGELRDLFNQYAEDLYSDQLAAEKTAAGEDEDDDDEKMDLEASIKAEVEGIKRPSREPLFVPVKLDVQCVLFFKTRAPVDPVTFVRHICRDAVDHPERKRTRFAKRLSPMTLIDKASEEGLEKVAKEVLAERFHGTPREPRKFAIRPTLRNHNILKRDSIIQKVASLVGSGHKVDLKNYDDLIIVEAYTNICGMAVVPNDFEELKRYNLAEIYNPTPKEQPKGEAGAAKEVKETAEAVEIAAPEAVETAAPEAAE